MPQMKLAIQFSSVELMRFLGGDVITAAGHDSNLVCLGLFETSIAQWPAGAPCAGGCAYSAHEGGEAASWGPARWRMSAPKNPRARAAISVVYSLYTRLHAGRFGGSAPTPPTLHADPLLSHSLSCAGWRLPARCPYPLPRNVTWARFPWSLPVAVALGKGAGVVVCAAVCARGSAPTGLATGLAGIAHGLTG